MANSFAFLYHRCPSSLQNEDLHRHPLPPVVQPCPGEQDVGPAGLEAEPERTSEIKRERQILVGRLGIDQDDVADDALAAVDADCDLAEVDGAADEVGQVGGREAEDAVGADGPDVVQADVDADELGPDDAADRDVQGLAEGVGH